MGLWNTTLRVLDNPIGYVGGLEDDPKDHWVAMYFPSLYCSYLGLFLKYSQVQEYCERESSKSVKRQEPGSLIGDPGQFTVLAHDNPDIVERSLEEFEYLVDAPVDGLYQKFF